MPHIHTYMHTYIIYGASLIAQWVNTWEYHIYTYMQTYMSHMHHIYCKHIYINMCINTYTYITPEGKKQSIRHVTVYIYIVCVCVSVYKDTHTHAYILTESVFMAIRLQLMKLWSIQLLNSVL